LLRESVFFAALAELIYLLNALCKGNRDAKAGYVLGKACK